MAEFGSNIVFSAFTDSDTLELVAERKRRDHRRERTGIEANAPMYERCSSAVTLFRARLESGASTAELEKLAISALRSLAGATRKDPKGLADYTDILWRLEELTDEVVSGLSVVYMKIVIPMSLMFGLTGERAAGKLLIKRVASTLAATSRDRACVGENTTLLSLAEAAGAVLLTGESEGDEQLIAIRTAWMVSQTRAEVNQYLICCAYAKIVEMRNFPADFIQAAIERRDELRETAGHGDDWYLTWVLALLRNEWSG